MISVCSLQFCTVTVICQQLMEFLEWAYLTFIDDVQEFMSFAASVVL